MKLDKKHLCIIGVAIALVFYLLGFWTGKKVYGQPFDTDVKTDTIIKHDTVPDLSPKPKDSLHIKYVTRWLKSKKDTVSQVEFITMHDTVAVEVPITSKHYGNETYDAWVSGFEPSLDSIKVYQKTEYVTKTITQMKPPNKLSLDVSTGLNYITNDKQIVPYLQGELTYKPSRFSFGVQGGVYKDNEDFKPYVGWLMKIRIL